MKRKPNKFTIGQKVRCIRATGLYQNHLQPDLEDGKIYTISKRSGIGTVMLEEANASKWYNENRFEEYHDYLDEELFIV